MTDEQMIEALDAELDRQGVAYGDIDLPALARAAHSLIAAKVADLELALDLALKFLGEQEPGDSRAVSNEFVAMAAIRCGQGSLEEARAIIRAALAPEPTDYCGIIQPSHPERHE